MKYPCSPTTQLPLPSAEAGLTMRAPAGVPTGTYCCDADGLTSIIAADGTVFARQSRMAGLLSRGFAFADASVLWGTTRQRPQNPAPGSFFFDVSVGKLLQRPQVSSTGSLAAVWLDADGNIA